MTTATDSSVWRLDSNQATLCTPQLTAHIDLLNPCAGLGKLVFCDMPIEGYALGVNIGSSATLSKQDVSDVFVRGSDLVVTYAETSERPFSLQVYWRVTVGEQGTLLLDAILSLQTDLLESFPDFVVETQLPASTEIAVPNEHSADQPLGILLRPTESDWSYAEATHPEDRGECQVEPGKGKSMLVRRQLGGQFLEKGVIRSLRVRGVFVPRKRDLDLATQCLASLATEEPPLTV